MTFSRRRSVRSAELIALLSAVLFVPACFKPGPVQVPDAVTIVLNQAGTSVGPGGTINFSATVYDRSNQGVTWTMTPLFGTLSKQTSSNQPSNYETMASVTYTAPANLAGSTSVTVTATSISNPTITSSLQFKVLPYFVSLQVYSQTTQVLGVAAPQTVGPGQSVVICGLAQVLGLISNESVTWNLLPPDAGSLTVAQNFNCTGSNSTNSATFVAPSGVSLPMTATVTATSIANPSSTASLQITVLPTGGGLNVAAVTIDGGPIPNEVQPNAAFTSITLCNPGSIYNCETVNGILVDTGSYGLRILQSQIPALSLPALTDGNGNTLENCASLADGSFLWGPVSQADVYLGGELATALPIQVINSTNSIVPDGCSNGGTQLSTPQLLRANGILGIGPEPTDCTLAGVNYCDGSTQATTPTPNVYYSCPSIGCEATDSPVILAHTSQVTNPVSQFSQVLGSGLLDNGGVVLQLPAVSGAESSVTGTLTFGINNESNNQVGTATVFTLDSNDNFTTLFNGQTLTRSFINSGSNALLFPDSLPACSDKSQFFCPASLTNLSAQMNGATQGQNTVNFAVDNADNLFSANPGSAAFSTLAGPEGKFQACAKGNSSCVFDWGLPFFYGRTVYVHIDGCSPLLPTCDALMAGWFAY